MKPARSSATEPCRFRTMRSCGRRSRRFSDERCPSGRHDEIAAAAGARIVGRLSGATGVSIDTRTLEPGDLFFAIKGEVHDGHGFVRDALAKGAAAAVVAEDRAAEFAGAGPLLVAPDVLDAMRRLGIAARQRSNAMIVAVTGSVGKTGTKEAMRLAFERLGPTHASVASYNNHWGVPLTLARLPRDAAYGVFEIGMNHAGEIEPLTRMVRPHVAVITTVEPVHIEFFRSISAIADAKGEIFCGIEPGGDRGAQPRQRRSSSAYSAHALASAGRPRHQLRRARERRRARRAHHPQARPVDRRGARARRRRSSTGVGAPGRHVAMNSLARARRREGARRRPRARGARRSPTSGRRPGAASASAAARRRRRLPPRRRGLQRQPGLDARGARQSRRDRASAARAPHRGPRRHARARSRRAGAAPRARARRSRRAAPTSSSPPDR